MIPKLEVIENYKGYEIFATTDQVAGLGIRIESCDAESVDASAFRDKLSSWLKNLRPSLRSRIITSVSNTSDSDQLQTPRAEAIAELGSRHYRHTVVIENDPKTLIRGLIFPKARKPNKSHSDWLIEAAEGLRGDGFQTEALTREETRALFIDDVSSWVQDLGSVETGTKSIGVIRLVKPLSRAIDLTLVSDVLSQMPHGSEIKVSVKRLPPEVSEAFLQKRLKQIGRQSHRESHVSDGVEDALLETSVLGESLFEYEFLCVVERVSKSELRSSLQKASRVLKIFGDVEIEMIGCGPSFVASLTGSSQHVGLYEKQSVLRDLLPLYRKGDSSEFKGDVVRALTLHRTDDSVTHVDLLDQSHQNGNAVIVGTSGKGKSVFLGALTQSLLNDPNVSVIKVDVGGSHSKECELLGGEEFKLSLSEPSGLNPFSLIAFDESRSSAYELERSILGQFLQVLILEEGETSLTKQMRSEIDQALQIYLIKRPLNPSLDDFVSTSVCLPRSDLFQRWVGTGIYANAFREKKRGENRVASDVVSCADLAESSSFGAVDFASGADEDSAFIRKRLMTRTNLRYINFSEIFQASDPEFATAAMAAVLAMFNLELKLFPERRTVLVCDETPFFIKKCFEFFKFSTANVRKFGASVILTVQVSGHLIVGSDTSVIDNSHHRFLFSVDGSEESFKERFGLRETQFEDLIRISERVHRNSSELLYQVGRDTKSLRLKLTREEYWKLTSSQSDRLKLEKLRAAVPELKLDEAIRCLSV